MSKQPSMLDVNPSVRRDEDFYPTPAWMTRALLRRLSSGWWVGGSVIEPCVGDGAILAAMPENADINWTTNDIVAREPMLPDFLLDARNIASWKRFRELDSLVACVTNPPFDVAFDIAEHAYEHVDVGMALLLRLSWLEPTDDRGPWLAAHPPTKLVVMPRHDFRGNGKTDSVTSAWCIWDKTQAGFTRRPGIEIVTKRERDELMRAA